MTGRLQSKRLTPMRRGFGGSLLLVFFLALCGWVILASLAPSPSAELLRNLPQIGATFFVAYAIEASWLEKVSRVRDSARENWIGATVGLAVGGLIGIVISLALAEQAAVGHWGWLDELGFAWASMSLGMLGIVVALLPLFVYEWSRNLDRDALEESE